jgi:hypothetical protein
MRINDEYFFENDNKRQIFFDFFEKKGEVFGGFVNETHPGRIRRNRVLPRTK